MFNLLYNIYKSKEKDKEKELEIEKIDYIIVKKILKIMNV